jgi:hypothetical protein
MKKIIVTIPAPSVHQIEAIGLALVASKMKEMVSQQFFLKTVNESVAICLN